MCVGCCLLLAICSSLYVDCRALVVVCCSCAPVFCDLFDVAFFKQNCRLLIVHCGL